MSKMILVASAGVGAGKTTVALGLAQALESVRVRTAMMKTGPRMGDAVLHAAARRYPCPNVDAWGQRLDTAVRILDGADADADVVLLDGDCGLFDDDDGHADANFAAILGLPILLVIDAQGAGRSLAAMVEGLLQFREDVDIVGLFVNRVRDADHAAQIAKSFDERFSTPVVGYLTDKSEFKIEDHHFRAAFALDEDEVDTLADRLGQAVGETTDLARMARLARPPSVDAIGSVARPLPVLGQRIAVAQDAAFALAQDVILTGWHRHGAQIIPFSPLADEPPSHYADAVYLPSGPFDDYAAILASNRDFMRGLAECSSRRAAIFGEGFGYSVLGEHFVDTFGQSHAMAALLPVTTLAQTATAMAGYRKCRLEVSLALGNSGSLLRGYDPDTVAETDRRSSPLFAVQSAAGADLGTTGCQFENVAGSPLQLMDRHPHLSVVRG